MRILELHAPYFAARWRQEHDVITWGPGAHCDLRPTAPLVRLSEILALLPERWEPDVILLGDDSNPLLVLGLEDAPCPTAMLSVDAHHHTAWHAPLASALDVVFVAQRDYLPAFWNAGAPDAQWLPLWAPDDLPSPVADKEHAVAFVGNLDVRLHPERAAFLDAVRSRLPLLATQGGWVDVFTRSRIVLNQTVREDLNARVFEAMACGAMLLTERTGNGLLDLFADGEELVTYPRGDVDAAVAAARHYLAAEHERATIAERGRARVRAAHLESHRSAEVLARLADPAPSRPAATRRAGAARAYCVLAHYTNRLHELLPDRFASRDLADRVCTGYLGAAADLARGTALEEPDRSAVLGALALERGETARALAHLSFAVEQGGRLEDHLMRIEALVRLGEVRRARDAACALTAAHPGYDLGQQWQMALDDIAPAAAGEGPP